ncbi:chalcone isomerase family protein [Crenobacter cavernae]|nr:chalcone isomerase family protein [Crenobacter cavernae]
MSGSWKSIVLSLALVAAITPVWAALPPPLAGRQPSLKARGSGDMRWAGFKLYEATLYTEAGGVFDWARPFALELRCARDFDGDQIAEVSRGEIDRVRPTPDQRSRWSAAVRRLFPSLNAGDVIVGAMDAGGVAFWHNGRFLGRVNEPAFARRFFGIWLDAATSEPDLRESLLGRKR